MSLEDAIVRIFYSSMTEPEILVFYADGISYLEESDIDYEIIDVDEEPEIARKYKVKATPLVEIRTREGYYQRFGVVSYLKSILERDRLKKELEGL